MTKKRRELTPIEKANAERLMAIFASRKRDNGMTQTKLADLMGITQSGVGQYLNGEIPLNLPALILFSIFLECQIQEIDPYCPHLIPTAPEEKGLVAAYRDMRYRNDRASERALLQVAELSPAYRVTLEHNAKKESSGSDS